MPPPRSDVLAEPRVLLVSGDQLTADTVGKCLRECNFAYLGTAQLAKDAGKSLHPGSPNALLIDLSSHREAAIQAALEAHQSNAAALIFLADAEDASLTDAVLECHAHGYLRHPFTSAELCAALEKAITRWEHEVEKASPIHCLNANPHPVLRISSQGILLFANPASQTLIDYCGCKVGHAVPEQFRSLIQQALDSGEIIQTEQLCGNHIFHLSWTPIMGSSVVNLYAVDVTQQKTIENDLRESERRLRTLVESTSTAILIIQQDHVVYANPAAERITGYSLDELNALQYVDLVHPDSRQQVLQIAAEFLQGSRRSERVNLQLRTQDQRAPWVEIIGDWIVYQGQPAGMVTFTDISERLQAEQALRQSEEGYRNIIQSTPAGLHMYRLDADDRLILNGANPSADKILGIDHRGLFGLPIEQVFPGLANMEIPNILKDIARSGGTWQNDQVFYEMDGIRGLYDVHAFQNGPGQVTVSFSDVTERRQTTNELARRARELDELYQTSLEINTLSDIPGLLSGIVRRAADLVGAPMGGLYLVTPDRQSVVLAVSHNIPGNFLGIRLKMGEGLSGKVAQTGEALMTEDYRGWEGRAAAFQDTPFRRVLGVPLKSSDEVIGVIDVTDTQQSGPFSPEEIRLVKLFADQAAIAIANARLYEKLQHELAERQRAETSLARHVQLMDELYITSLEINTLSDIPELLNAIVNRAANLLNVSVGGLYLYEPSTQELGLAVGLNMSQEFIGLKLKPGEGLAGKVAQSGEIEIIDDYQTWNGRAMVFEGGIYHRAIGVPLTSGQELLGVFFMTDTEHSGPFTDEEIRLVSLFADQAGAALGNARLLNQIQIELNERIKAESALRDQLSYMQLVTEISALFINPSGSDIREPIQASLKLLIDYIGADTCSLQEYHPDTEQYVLMGACTREPGQKATDSGNIRDYPHLAATLQSGQTFLLTNLEGISESNFPELATLKQLNLQGILIHPLTIEGKLYGALCFTTYHRSCTWDTQLADKLSLAADILTNALARRQSETALRASEQRYRQVSELTSDFAYAISLTEDGQFDPDWATEAAFRVTGYSMEEFDPDLKWFFQLIYPEDLSHIQDQVPRLLSGETVSADVRILTKNGDIRWLHNYTRPVWDDQQKRIIRLLGAARDITEQKIIDQALVEQFRFEQLLAELSSSLIRQPADRLDDQIIHGLELLANYLEVDRCTLHQYNPDFDSSIPRFTWGKAGISGAYAVTADSPLAFLMDMMKKGRVFQYPFSVLQTDDTQSIAGLLDSFGLKSLLLIPLAITEGFYSLACVSYNQTKSWTDETIQQMMLVLEIFGSALSRQQAMNNLSASETRYRRLVELAPYGVAILNNGKIVYANETAFRHFRAEREEQVIGMPILDFVPADDHELVVERLRQLAMGQDLPPFEERFLRLDGSVMEVEVTCLSITHQGQPAGLVMIHDITERKRSAETLARRADELAALQATLLNITTPNTLPQVLEAIVEQAVRLLGAPSGALYLCDPVEQQVRCVVSYQTARDYTGVMLRYGEGAGGTVAQTGKALTIDDYRTWESRAEIFEQEQPFTSVLAVPMMWHGEVTGVIIALDDNKAHRFTQSEMELLRLFANHAAIAVENTRLYEEALREEQRVRESEERFRSAFDDAPVGMTLTGLDGRYLRINQAFCEMIGYTVSELLGMNFLQITHPDDIAVNQDKFQQILAGKTNTFSMEKRYRHRQGTIVWVNMSTSLLRDVEGNPLYFITHIINITEQKKAEEAELARLERISRQQQALIHLTTRQTINGGLAAALQEITRTTAEVMKVEHASIWLIDNDAETIHCQDKYQRSTGEHSRANSLHKDQVPIYLQNLIHERVIATHDALHDERTLEFADEYLTINSVTSMLDAGIRVSGQLVGVISLDHVGPQRVWTEDEIAFAGEIADQIAQAILSNQHQLAEDELRESEARMVQMADTVNEVFWIFDFDNGDLTYINAAYERIFKLPADELFTNAIAWHRAVHPDDLPTAQHVSNLHAEGKAADAEFRIILPDGSIRWILLRATPVLDERGKPYRMIGSAQDITEAKQRETEMSAVLKVSTVLRSAQSRSEIMQLTLQQLTALLNTDGAMIALVAATLNAVEILQATGSWSAAAGKQIPVGEGVNGQVAASGQPCFNTDGATSEQLLEEEFTPVFPAIASVPLITRHQTIGVLTIGRKAEFSPAEIRLLLAVSEIAANAIHRSDLHEQTQRHVERLSALHNVDIAISTNFNLNAILDILLEQVISQLQVSAADILLYNPHTHGLEFAAGQGFNAPTINKLRLRLNDSLAGRSVLERKIVYVPDIRLEDPKLLRHMTASGEEFSAYVGLPLMVKGQVKGVLEIFHHKSIPPDPEGMSFLESLANQAAIAIDNTQMFENLQRSNLELSVAYDATIEGWARALELRDMETEGHSERVTELTVQLAVLIGLNNEEQMHLRRGALLHDIGKMGIPDAILRKPGPLNDEEWEIMRQHPVFAYRLLAPIDFLRPAAEIPYCHHERWDGSGYPRCLAGEQIPIAARVFSVIDVYDALTSRRPYRAAWTHELAIAYIRDNRGKLLDPRVVDAFLTMIS